jgi:protein KRI1
MATDAGLNQYLSVKRYAPYRKETRWDSMRNERLKELKQKVAERAPTTWDVSEERPVRKRKGKKERQKMKTITTSEGDVEVAAAADDDDWDLVGEKRKCLDVDGNEEGAEASQENRGIVKKRRRHKKMVQ